MSNGDPSSAQGLVPVGAHAPLPTQQRYLIARLGSFLLDRRNDDTPDEVVARLAHVLDEDPRVTSVTVPVTDPKWNHSPRYFPYNADIHDDSLLRGADGFRGLVLSEPLRFTVNVPKKNQRLLSSDDEPPAETYHVVWDGSIIAVGWEQIGDELQLTGGQIVADILHEASHEAGHDLFIQACNPMCDWLFIHSTLRITADPSANERSLEPLRPGGQDLAVVLPEQWDPEELLDEVYYWLHGPIEEFAQMRNVGQRILDIEAMTRHDLDLLLHVREKRAELGTEPFHRTIRQRWKERGWRRRSEQVVARLWLELSVLERLRRLWLSDRLDFENMYQGERDSARLLLNRDTRDISIIESLDMSIIQAGLEHAASRLDNRAIIQTTAWATLAGAVGGGIVSAIL